MADETRLNHIICMIHFPPPNTSALTLNLTGFDCFRQGSWILTEFLCALSHFEIGGDKRIYQHLSGTS
jgi:hypothetical protein